MHHWLTAAALLSAAAGCSAPPPPPPPVPLAGDATIRLFERRTDADPRDHLSATTLADLRLVRAERTQDAADFKRAEAAARTALERQPGHPAAIVALARALAGEGDRAAATHELDQLLALQPRHVGALGAAFDVALAEGHVATARSLADRLLAINEDPGTLRRLADLAVLDGDTDRAVSLLRRAAADAAELGALGWEIAGYRVRAGDALVSAKRLDEAAAEFDAALIADPEDPAALRGRRAILALQRSGDTRR